MSPKELQIINIGLLMLIFIVLCCIWSRMPARGPTYGDFKGTEYDAELMKNVPVIKEAPR